MWLIFGSVAILMTGINLYRAIFGKDFQLSMALALSFTALTLCAENSLIANWVRVEDWAALQDVVPTMEKALWFLTLTAIVLNIAPLFFKARNKKIEASQNVLK